MLTFCIFVFYYPYSLFMGKNSFANKLSWSIIGIVSVIYLAALVIIAVIFYQLMTDEATHLSQESLAHASRMYFNLIVVGLLGLVVIFFVCRHVIKTKTRPVTEELETTSIANERMESELNVARAIQMGMLNTKFPEQLYAMLCPAKEVGGDFYDFSLKDGKLYFAIGDVSGKGVPASLMMALTSVIMRFVAGLGLPINTMLERINNSVSEANSHGMFVTLFVARLDIRSGHLEYCNAGHNPIVVIPPEGDPYFLKAKPNIAIGLLGDFHYEGESLELKPGTRLVAYTDGVTEAEQASLSQFGDDRLMSWAQAIAQENATIHDKEVVESLYQTVKHFAGDNPQNDDIAIMSLKFDPNNIMTKRRFNPIKDKSIEIIEFLMASPDMPADEELRFKLRLSIEEAVENVVRYAYDGGIGWLEVGTSLDHDALVLTVELRDAGVPFNPLEQPDPDTTSSAEERQVGGLGIYLCKKLMDSIDYRYEDGNNVLTMKKLI